jgi:glucose-specific phosphotransferase system IIA component
MAPLAGLIVPIEQVPDPVFAQKMVGEGMSIDPLSNRLLAPCDGEVVQLHASHHAVTIRAAGGLEVLLHIGLDTVQMRGEGFTPRVSVGGHVSTGDELIDFDLDKVATNAKSLVAFVPKVGLVCGRCAARRQQYAGHLRRLRCLLPLRRARCLLPPDDRPTA